MSPSTGRANGLNPPDAAQRGSEMQEPDRAATFVVRENRFSASSAARYFLQWLNQLYAMMLATPAASGGRHLLAHGLPLGGGGSGGTSCFAARHLDTRQHRLE